MMVDKKSVILCGNLLVCFWFLIVSAVPCFASGYCLYEWSARGSALGGTLVARANDPSAVIYNPAGITQLPGTQMTMGFTIVNPSMTLNFTDPSLEDGYSEDKSWVIPNSFLTHQINDNVWLGMGIYSRVGLGSSYENKDTYAGRYSSTNASIESVSFTPNLAYKISDNLSVAAGAEVIYMAVDLDSYTNYFGEGKIASDGYAFGYNLAVHYKPTDWMALGLTYRSQIDLTVDGEIEFSSASYLNTTMTATEPVPEQVAMGIMVKPMDRLSLEFDAVYTKWSAYENLSITYSNVLGTQTTSKDWEDTWKFGFGVEYTCTEWLVLRAGYVYDNTPVPDDTIDYAIPGSDRQIFSVGTGITYKNWTFDFSCGYLILTDRYIEGLADGTYESTIEDGYAPIIGFNTTYRF
jgi:long-chain fatty acid transport protein